MKKMNIGSKKKPAIVEYYNPIFREVELENDITQFRLESKYNPKGEPIEVKVPVGMKLESRKVTLCHVAIPVMDIILNQVGVAIMNPEDEDGELGETIAEGRAVKSPINMVTIMSEKRLPKPIIEEQLTWAEKHVERNLDEFVNNLRETLKH